MKVENLGRATDMMGGGIREVTRRTGNDIRRIGANLLAVALLAGIPCPAEDFQPAFALLPAPAHSDLTDTLVEHRLKQQLDTEVKRLRASERGAVLAPSCLQSATFSDFFVIGDLKEAVAVAPAASEQAQIDLSRPAHSLNDTLEVLRTTEIGRAILKKFIPKFGFEIKVAGFSAASPAQQRGAVSQLGRPAALFDANEKTIYIDEKRELGQVAFVLLHEIVHSLDGDFAKAFEKEKSMRKRYQGELKKVLQRTGSQAGIAQSELESAEISNTDLKRLAQQRLELEQFRDVRIFRAERFAYDASYRVWLELDYRYPGYYRRGERGLAGKPVQYDDEQLVRILQLDPLTIASYRKRACRTPADGG